jgi:hypothetical protein
MKGDAAREAEMCVCVQDKWEILKNVPVNSDQLNDMHQREIGRVRFV